MLFLILIVVIALVAWALRLMEQAIESQEFSFMLAGFLVASSAAAMMAVYFLMNNYMIYMDQAISTMPAEVTISYDLQSVDYSQLLNSAGPNSKDH
ncbi:MAG: hypothetical protein F6K42_32620 [Leptolyngbya sp. SIO1D8]|nr:hypothetical protein [Leptolyngbya sp. SIO1D8]